METHPPHIHHSSGKKFSNYFYEFLMLFLAVFCGFMAENFREEKVEHSREKGFMKTLVEDLKTDTSNLKTEIELGEIVSDRLDSLVQLLNEGTQKENVFLLYKLNNKSSRVVRVDFEDRTSSQLKNAGNMRLIYNNLVADSIRSYWSKIKVLENISNRLEDITNKAQDLSIQIFHNKYISISDMHDPIHSTSTILPDPKLINDNSELIAQYSNRRSHSLLVLRNYVLNLKRTTRQAVNLINFIEKEYQLK